MERCFKTVVLLTQSTNCFISHVNYDFQLVEILGHLKSHVTPHLLVFLLGLLNGVHWREFRNDISTSSNCYTTSRLVSSPFSLQWDIATSHLCTIVGKLNCFYNYSLGFLICFFFWILLFDLCTFCDLFYIDYLLLVQRMFKYFANIIN